jgi:16S rRNA (guanine527-N7)-methyltransferase
MEDLLARAAKELGVELSPEQLNQFEQYTVLLLEWNERMNLTGITDPTEIKIKHHVDSLTCLRAGVIPKAANLADVGTGAGFPGVPLAIARPDLRVTLIDSTKKRLTFLEAVRDVIFGGDAERIRIVHARAEEAGRLPEHRESYAVVVARAVADLRVLAEYCLPLARVRGKFIAMKGPDVADEVSAARAGIGTLGGCAPEIIRLTLPGTNMGRTLIVVRKTKPTPEQFPRHGSKISQKPL